MVKGINQQICTKCRLCEDVCMQDVYHFNEESNVMEVSYPGDCCNCFECYFACGVEAITMTADSPAKFSPKKRWEQIKTALLEEETKI